MLKYQALNVIETEKKSPFGNCSSGYFRWESKYTKTDWWNQIGTGYWHNLRLSSYKIPFATNRNNICFRLQGMACGILVPQPGIKLLSSPALGAPGLPGNSPGKTYVGVWIKQAEMSPTVLTGIMFHHITPPPLVRCLVSWVPFYELHWEEHGWDALAEDVPTKSA